jgi:hypothetical protein
MARNKNELIALLKTIAGRLVVSPCLIICTGGRRFLLGKSRAGMVLLARKLFVHAHCINELPVAGALAQVRSAGTCNPVALFRQFNDVPRFSGAFTILAQAQRTNTEIGIWRKPSVMIDDVGVKLPMDILFLRFFSGISILDSRISISIPRSPTFYPPRWSSSLLERPRLCKIQETVCHTSRPADSRRAGSPRQELAARGIAYDRLHQRS